MKVPVPSVKLIVSSLLWPTMLPLIVPPRTLSVSPFGDNRTSPASSPAFWSIVIATEALDRSIAATAPLIVPVLTMWPSKVPTLPTRMPTLAEIDPVLVIPPENVWMPQPQSPTAMPMPAPVMVPLLCTPPVNSDTLSTVMPKLESGLASAIRPPLLMPPPKLPVGRKLPIAIPAMLAVIVPLLAMPPKNEPTPMTKTPVASAAIMPLLVIPPPALEEPKSATDITAMPAPTRPGNAMP